MIKLFETLAAYDTEVYRTFILFTELQDHFFRNNRLLVYGMLMFMPTSGAGEFIWKSLSKSKLFCTFFIFSVFFHTGYRKRYI